MTTVSERRQHLDFDGSWQVIKWDEAREYTGQIEAAVPGPAEAQPVKATDVVAARASLLVVAEFKDFDLPSIPQQEREQAARGAASDKLAPALVRKVIDSLAGATFSHDLDDARCAPLRSFAGVIADAKTPMLVLFCIEVTRTQAAAIVPLTTLLKKRLRWLGPNARVLVVSGSASFADVGVEYRVD